MASDLVQLVYDGNWQQVREELLRRSCSAEEVTAALTKAMFKESLEGVELLLAAGGDPNKNHDDSNMPAMCAAAENLWLPGLRLLTASGGDSNARAYAGWTPLMYAVDAEADALLQGGGARTLEVIEFLLLNGADPALRNDQGKTAIDIARDYDWDEAIRLMSGSA